MKMMKETKGKLDLGTCMPLNKAALLHSARSDRTAPHRTTPAGTLRIASHRIALYRIVLHCIAAASGLADLT